MLQSHLCGVLNLCHAASKELTGSAGCHGTCHSYFALAPDIGSADAGVVLDEVADEPGGGQGMQDAFLGEGVVAGEVVEHGGQYATAAAGGGGDDASAGCVLLADGKGVGVNEAIALEVGLVALGLDVVNGGLALEPEGTGEHAFVVDAALHGFLHDLPHLAQIVPDGRSLAAFHIFPEGAPALLAPGDDVLHGVQVVERRGGGGGGGAGALGECSASDAVHGPWVAERAVGL